MAQSTVLTKFMITKDPDLKVIKCQIGDKTYDIRPEYQSLDHHEDINSSNEVKQACKEMVRRRTITLNLNEDQIFNYVHFLTMPVELAKRKRGHTGKNEN